MLVIEDVKRKTSEDGELIVYNADYRGMVNEDTKADLIIADPPYNLNVAEWDNDFDFYEMLSIFKQSLNPDGSCLIFNTYSNVMKMTDMAEQIGLMVQDILIWQKSNPLPVYHRKQGYTKYDKEFIAYLSNSENPYFRLGVSESWHSGIFRYSSTSRAKGHYCEKPKLLIEELVRKHSRHSDVVFDCFLGSGVVSNTAHELGRRVRGWETDKEWFDKFDC